MSDHIFTIIMGGALGALWYMYDLKRQQERLARELLERRHDEIDRMSDSNGTVEHRIAKDNGDFCEMLRKPRVAGGNPGDRYIEGLLAEIVGEKDCERIQAEERTRAYREAHCSHCGQPLRKEDHMT